MHGVKTICLDWICSYLTRRKQYVRIDNNESDMQCINCGVPQGSILGPILFTIYINDIVKISDTLQMILFADATNMFLPGLNFDDICSNYHIPCNVSKCNSACCYMTSCSVTSAATFT